MKNKIKYYYYLCLSKDAANDLLEIYKFFKNK